MVEGTPWSSAFKLVVLVQPSSAAAERVFSLLTSSFTEQQESSLEANFLSCYNIIHVHHELLFVLVFATFMNSVFLCVHVCLSGIIRLLKQRIRE